MSAAEAEMTPGERARRLLDEQANMTVATVGADGTPWVSPVFFVPDADYDLFWTSEKTARHSDNIRVTGRAAIVVVESDPQRRVDAVYMDALCQELSDASEVAAAIGVIAAAGKSQPERWSIQSPADVTGDGPWRIYRARPVSMSVRTTDEAGGKPVARRRDADFRPRHAPPGSAATVSSSSSAGSADPTGATPGSDDA